MATRFDHTFCIAGEAFTALPEKALFWQRERTLVVADLHFGKAAAFRRYGIAVPGGTTRDNLDRLTAALERTGAERLLILGDLLHAHPGRTRQVVDQVSDWRAAVETLAIDLVLGNHDRHAGPPPEAWRMDCKEERIEPPFVWRHEPGASDDGYVVAGHLHPGVELREAKERLRLPCFYFGATYGVLPAFGEFTGTSRIVPRRGDTVLVVADGRVIPVHPVSWIDFNQQNA